VISLLIIVTAEALIRLEQGNSLQKSLDEIQNNSYIQSHHEDYIIIKTVYQIAFNKTFDFDLKFIYIIGAGATFAIFTQFFSLLVISEGKQAFIVIVAVACNLFNILLDFVLIKYAQLAMVGGAIALVLG
jgi:Na+-driven multidrug efflux pump